MASRMSARSIFFAAEINHDYFKYLLFFLIERQKRAKGKKIKFITILDKIEFLCKRKEINRRK